MNKYVEGRWWSKISDRYVSAHVKVWEDFMETPVPEGCVIHHFNQDKQDNRIENLVCMTRAEHMRFHASHRSKESLKIMREKKLNIKQSDDHRNKISNSLKKYKKTEEHKKALSESRKKFLESHINPSIGLKYKKGIK